ncbi:hypothetical protein EI168_14755 [Halomonas sp. FME1]|uniref:Uncharacterized protein n=1 Tax=Halomonas casei TaxID=2742613 RepID=A0ABR9F4D4_9GAMM|nr:MULTISPECIES: hypothetical protein [Halomonas]MBE0401350.1 hypothetical protein [Halomonas casei]WKD30481.1 hypothetical protein NDQ72_20485 [Halomonas sp. KG2]
MLPYRVLPAMALGLGLGLAIPPALGAAKTVMSSGDTVSDSTHHHNVQIVVSHDCQRAWYPDIGDRLQIEVQAAHYRPDRHLATITAEPLERHGRFAEPRRRLDVLTADGQGNMPPGASAPWVNAELLSGASSVKPTGSKHRTPWRTLPDWTPPSSLSQLKSAGAQTLTDSADEKAQSWLPRLNNSAKYYIHPLVEKVRSVISKEGDGS